MTEPGKGGWTEETAKEVLGRLCAAVEETLEKEVPGGMTDFQARRLREALSESLVREAALDARRVTRRFLDEERRRTRRREKRRAKIEAVSDRVERLSLHLRIQHMVLFASCIVLIVTGLPIKFHEAALASFVIGLLGGAEVARILHRIGAIGLTGIGLYHIFYTMAFEAGRKDFGLLIPKLQDVKDFLHQMAFYFGRRKDRPLFGRFSYIEKFDYWAVYWGMVVMITSGYILWFKDLAINQFGKFVFDIAREAHSDEALLATLAIIIWHFYNVHFNPSRFPGSLTWWNGKITLEEFKEEHPLEYEQWLAQEMRDDEGGGGP